MEMEDVWWSYLAIKENYCLMKKFKNIKLLKWRPKLSSDRKLIKDEEIFFENRRIGQSFFLIKSFTYFSSA